MKLKRLITKIKLNAYTLKKEGQIPPLLFSEICSLDDQCSEQYVKALMDLTYQLMRVKGFYFRFHENEIGIDKIIKDFKEKSGKVD